MMIGLHFDEGFGYQKQDDIWGGKNK